MCLYQHAEMTPAPYVALKTPAGFREPSQFRARCLAADLEEFPSGQIC